jgi:predicted transcriptional regulator
MVKKNISLEEMRKKRHVDAKRVRRLRDSILAESRAVRLAEFRKSLELTQIDIAKILGVDQSNVSRIERGRFSNTEVGTLQAYVEALGGTLEIHARIGRKSHRLVDSEPIKVK